MGDSALVSAAGLDSRAGPGAGNRRSGAMKGRSRGAGRALLLLLLLLAGLLDAAGAQDGPGRRTDKSMKFREPKKMFGGYRITPRFCTPSRPTRRHKKEDERRGPAICMFNHECSQRNGEVVGACMDGFLFGACCQLFGTPGVINDDVQSGVVVVANSESIKNRPGLIINDQGHLEDDINFSNGIKIGQASNNLNDNSNVYVVKTTERTHGASTLKESGMTTIYSNDMSKSPDDFTNQQIVEVSHHYVQHPSTLAVSISNNMPSSTEKFTDLTLSGVAQISNTLLQNAPNTADIVGVHPDTGLFSHSTISHEEADTVLLNENGSILSDISRPSDFSAPDVNVQVSTMQTKPSMSTQYIPMTPSTTPSTTIFTHKPVYQKPVFRPKPTRQPANQDKFVLVQTVTKPGGVDHNTASSNGASGPAVPEMASFESIMNMLNDSHPSTITYDSSTSSTNLVDRDTPVKPSTAEMIPSTAAPQSYSSGYPTNYEYETTSFRFPTSGHYITTAVNKYTTSQPPSTSYIYSHTVSKRPASTDKFTSQFGSTSFYTNRPSGYQDTTKLQSVETINYPSSTLSYDDYWGSSSNVYSSTPGNRKPPSTSYVFSPVPTRRPVSNIHNVNSNYDNSDSNLDNFSSVTPTVIVIGSPDPAGYESQTPNPIKFPNRQPVVAEPSTEENFVEIPLKPPHKKPVNLVTINNLISSTNVIHLGQQPSYNNQITPSPSDSPVPTVLITPKPSQVTTSGTVYTRKPQRPNVVTVGNPDRISSAYTTPSPFTTNKAPSTSYVFSSTISRRPTTPSPSTNIQSSYSTLQQRPRPTFAPQYAQTTFKPEVQTSPDDMINFPPVRNPNLNATGSNPAAFNTTVTHNADDSILQEVEFTTPAFLQEDEDLNDKMSLFVNKIVGSLQGTFQELHDIVILDKTPNTTITQGNKKPADQIPTKKPSGTPTKRPASGVTTKKPVKVPAGSTTKKPVTTKKPARVTTTTKKPVTTIITSSATTKKPTKVSTTTKKPRPTKPKTTTLPPTISTTEAPIIEEEDAFTTELPNGDYRHLCGVRPMVKSGRIVGGKGATFGEWPWQVLVRESTWLGLFTKNKCGGVLLTNRFVTTAAHCQPGFLASLVAVFGEFDISGELESKRSVTKNVRRVIVHRQYDAATFENDLALLELDSPVHYDTHIVPICMPSDEADFTGRMATVTGWGRLKYGGGVPSVLQEVQVPVIENSVCQEMFQTAGHSKVILQSFLCAGYANGQKDSCEGDSGGPLVLQRPDGRWELAGTVSHGIKCAAPYLPGVYMRTTFYKPWLRSITGVE